MKVGMQVKIPDIEPLATVAMPGRQMVKVELFGERFWIERRLVEVVK